jgi:hypothetical protein
MNDLELMRKIENYTSPDLLVYNPAHLCQRVDEQNDGLPSVSAASGVSKAPSGAQPKPLPKAKSLKIAIPGNFFQVAGFCCL